MADGSTLGRGDADRASGANVAEALYRRGVFGLVLLGPVLAILTAFLLSDGAAARTPPLVLRIVLLVDLCYILILAAVITWRLATLFLERRKRSAGTRLHLRLAGVFAAVALLPTVLVAVFATLTLGVGLESLFSDRIGSVVRNSLATAAAYEREHREELRNDIVRMAGDLNEAARQGINQAQLGELVVKQALVRELPTAYVFNLDKQILARGEFSYLFNFIAPSEEQLAAARLGEIVIIRDPERNEMRALVYLTSFLDSFLYISQTVQGDVLRLLDETRGTVQLYERLERERGSILFDYAVIYLGFALFVILGAIVLGLWFAERLAKPVGRLAGAAEAVGAGNLDVRVKEAKGRDEIATLSRSFNRMTGQLKGQRDALVRAHDESERRRQFSEAVLSGVTAGVIGLDRHGQVDLINEGAADMLGLSPREAYGTELQSFAEGFVPLVASAQEAPSTVARGEVRQLVRGEAREFLARVAPKYPDAPKDGVVLTFDDITALASAQRMAAWGDVARRIAHEIKNPLTPIQLSADRMRRKLVKQFGDEGADFEQYLDVITRQAGDIGRMVDEFSKFARMPEPTLESHDLAALLREAVLLQEEAHTDIAYKMNLTAMPNPVNVDRGLIGQVLTNLLKNAAESIEQRQARDADASPEPVIHAEIEEGLRFWRLRIMDNGIGLPPENRDRLTDPYVTTRSKGTGLGLAIVKKIVEQHGGELALGDADAQNGLDGAEVTIRLPKHAAPHDVATAE
ncbi:MAG: PAS domain-containing sensor histidine kinase [Pseudomonadota bacterium]